MTFADLTAFYIDQLSPLYDRQEAGSISRLALEYVCKVPGSFVMLHRSEVLNTQHETALIRILDELKTGVPIQYILQESYFYGLRFKVAPGVLIPRPETEELIDWVVKYASASPNTNYVILDIGTGSGCIPVSIKKNIPGAAVEAMDISDASLDIARFNASENKADIHFWQGDILLPNVGKSAAIYDIIISNPPYITLDEKAAMEENVLAHEPHHALFVPNEDPLLFYRNIARYARVHLRKDGALFFEINENFGPETVKMLLAEGFASELRQDINGKDRMIKAIAT